jgi:hypothetical protein
MKRPVLVAGAYLLVAQADIEVWAQLKGGRHVRLPPFTKEGT